MITVKNFNEVVSQIPIDSLIYEMEHHAYEYFSIRVVKGNKGSYVEFEAMDYCPDKEKEHESNGWLFIEKDNLISQMQDMDTVGYMKQSIIEKTTFKIETALDAEWCSLYDRTLFFNTTIEECTKQIEKVLAFESEFITN